MLEKIPRDLRMSERCSSGVDGLTRFLARETEEVLAVHCGLRRTTGRVGCYGGVSWTCLQCLGFILQVAVVILMLPWVVVAVLIEEMVVVVVAMGNHGIANIFLIRSGLSPSYSVLLTTSTST